MKKSNWFIVLTAVLALALALSSAACAEAAADASNPVLASFDGQDIALDEVKAAVESLYANNYISSETDYATGVQYLLNEKLILSKIKELGFDQFTAEEEEAFMAEAQAEWKAAVDSYMSYFLTEDTDEARAQAEKDGDAYFRARGYSEEVLVDSLKDEASYDRLIDYMMEGKDVKATDEEIQNVFLQNAAQHQSMYEGNVQMYEIYQNFYGAESWYKPEGYRGVTHILIKVDDALLKAFQDAEAAYEESVTDEAPDGDETLKAARDAAKAAVIASKQDVIDDIYARLANGEEFAALIRQYGEDPGMTDEARLLTGYEVHKDSIAYDPAFTAGAFSEKMLNPGDTSDPVVGSYGIHIIHYLRDVPGGIVEMTDEIKAEIESSLTNQKMSEVYTQTIDQWMAEHEVVLNYDTINALTEAAQAPAAEAPAQEQPAEEPAAEPAQEETSGDGQ